MTKVAYYNLPDVGEGLTEAEIVSWKVAVGDTVTVNQIVVEIETAKSLVELPVPFAGVVSELLAKEGDTVEVGKPIISVTVDDNASSSAVTTSIPVIAEAAASAHQAVADAAATVAAEEKSPTLVGYGVSHSVGSSRRRRPGPVDLPVNKRHFDMVYSHMKYSDKPFMGSVTKPERAQDTVEMAARLFGDNFIDPATGKKYLHAILEAGGSRPALESFKAFRGREPTLDALLRHQGMR